MARPKGTDVKRPADIKGWEGYVICPSCGKEFTRYGMRKHRPRCPAKGQCYRLNEKICDCATTAIQCKLQGWHGPKFHE